MSQQDKYIVIMWVRVIIPGWSEKLWGREVGGCRKQKLKMLILFGLNSKFMIPTKIKEVVNHR